MKNYNQLNVSIRILYSLSYLFSQVYLQKNTEKCDVFCCLLAQILNNTVPYIIFVSIYKHTHFTHTYTYSFVKDFMLSGKIKFHRLLMPAVFSKISHSHKLNWIEKSIGRLWACHKTMKCLHQQAAYHSTTALSSTKHFCHAKPSNHTAIYWTFGYIAYLLLSIDNDRHGINNYIWNEKERCVLKVARKADMSRGSQYPRIITYMSPNKALKLLISTSFIFL